MNSAKQFSTNFTSVWSLLTPTMDYYIRKINMHLFEQEFSPLETSILAARRGFINEVAFRRFEIRTKGIPLDDEMAKKIITEAANFIDVVDRSGRKVERTIDDIEKKDIDLQTSRLEIYCNRIAYDRGAKNAPSTIECKPFLKGCGFVDSGFGDIIVGDMLIEVKGGERSFRSIDLRQVLTYLCLLKIEGNKKIQHIGLLNPRKGVSFQADVDIFSSEVCGRPAVDLLHDLSQVMSASGISR